MFGMGTGGSLRLLSPETLSGSVFPHPQNCTGSEFLSPDQGLSYPVQNSQILLTNQFAFALAFSFRSLFRSALPLTFRLRSKLPYSLLPTPFCLFQDQALDLLVSSSSIRYRTSTDDLSTLSSSRGLTSFRCGNSILQGGFTLRCLQRLSRPHFASQLCHWHDNCCTRGASIPVLSY